MELKKVLLIERGEIAGGSTAAGMGHIVAMDDSPAQFSLTRLSQELWTELSPELPASCEFQKTGTIWVATGEEELSHVGPKCSAYREMGLRAEVLDSKQLAEAEPSLKNPLAGGLLIPNDSVIYPMTAAAWLLSEAQKRGVKVAQGHSVVRMGNQQVVLEDGTIYESPNLINAAGDHAGKLTPSLPIEPRKGHLIITDRYPGYVRHQLVELGYLKSAHEMSQESVAFNAQPRATGQVLLGSSRQFVGWDTSIDMRLVSKMVRRASEFLPGLAALSAVRIWVGFRATTPNKLPLIGRTKTDPSVIAAAGHEGLGITTSLATGKLVADIVANRPSSISRSSFSPDHGEKP